MPFARFLRSRTIAAGGLLAAVAACGSLAAALLLAVPAQAQSVQRIAAVVNDRVISLRDVETRMDMLMATSNVPDTAEVKRQLLPRVVRSLIDEQLKLQEAERLGITVNASEIDGAKREIEQNNNMPPGGLDQILRRTGTAPATIEQQLRAEVAWVKVVRRSLSRDIYVEPAEIDAVLETMRRNLGKPERLLSEIVLAVDPSSTSEDQARQAAERLARELAGGADFAAVARQVSSTATAGGGGDLGWVTQGSLIPELEEALRSVQPGEVTRPVRTTTGYTILHLRDTRTRTPTPPDALKVQISQLVMPLSGPAAVPDAKRSEIAAQLATADSCDPVNRLAEQMSLPSSGAVGVMAPDRLPPPIRSVVVDLPENTLSPPITFDGAEILLMVCGRESADGLPSRDQVEQSLIQQKLERAAQRALRDLRNTALIDIRL